MPKDIVSGDFYWYSQKGKNLIIAAADCTGHGVPGAFMSMLGIAFLNEITGQMKKYLAGTILDRLRENVIKSLHQSDERDTQKDGMDIALMVLDMETRIIKFAGAYNPLYIFRNNELIEHKGNRMPIGIHARDKEKFINHELQLEKGDELFLFTDGFPDQFGGPKGKKYNYKKFKTLLKDNCAIKNQEEKREHLHAAFLDWKGEHEQLDDVLVIGVSID
jgi:serine phosphatase RsbU (regulator of sigma subunit)